MVKSRTKPSAATPGGIFIKLGPKGSEEGEVWDDGVYPLVRRIILSHSHNKINSIQFVYEDDDGAAVLSAKHGGEGPNTVVIPVKTQIIQIDGCYGSDTPGSCVIKSLHFILSKKKKSLNFVSQTRHPGEYYGAVGSSKSNLPVLPVCAHAQTAQCKRFSFQDAQGFTGFHGLSDGIHVTAFGVYLNTTASRHAITPSKFQQRSMVAGARRDVDFKPK